MNLNSVDIEELIALCRLNNQQAQFVIYQRYSQAMYNVAYRIVKDAQFAEDVMQEAFLKVFTKIQDFKGEVAFGAYLKRIVVNCSIDFYKKNHKFKMEDFGATLYKLEDPQEENEEGLNIKSIKVQEVLQAIASLKYNYSMILSLYYIEGYDQEEISEILHISYANCRTTLSRAKESLRNKLREFR